MKKHATLFEQGDHRWTIFYFDDVKGDHLIGTNEYLVQNKGHYLMTDPGGTECFPEIIAAVSEVADLSRLDRVFCSHQDPDIFSSVALWLMMKPQLKVYVPHIWVGFMLHFGGYPDTYIPVSDEGMMIDLGNIQLQALPAHYLHSSGNLHLFDATAKVLFTGDTGAALTSDPNDFIVRDFDKHIPHMEKFHQRWFGSNEHKNQWCERVKELDLNYLCPQHGLVFEGPMVAQFLDWLYNLRVGIVQY